jgi:hypothetical protein
MVKGESNEQTQSSQPSDLVADQRCKPIQEIIGGSGAPMGITRSPPSPGEAVNRGGTFNMGTLKKGKK